MSNNTNNNLQQNQPMEEDEIDLLALAKTLWNGRKTVIKTTLIFMILGLFIAIFSEKEYTASSTIVPQVGDSKKIGGNLAGLASMAGINLESVGVDTGIPPMLYPQIINSIPFQKELLKTPLTIKGQKNQLSYEKYYKDVYSPGPIGLFLKYTLGLPGIIIKALKGKQEEGMGIGANPALLRITEDEKELMEQLTEQLVLEVNVKDGHVSLSASMPEAQASAELALRAQELLQQYIIDFKIQRSKNQLQFIQERFDEKEKQFKSVQQQLARFQDYNRNMQTNLARTNIDRLQSEYDIAFSVYADLANQLESQKIQVKEDTPVFTILKPVSVPAEKSKPKRPLILIIWTFLGGIIGVATVFGKVYFDELKVKWKEQ